MDFDVKVFALKASLCVQKVKKKKTLTLGPKA